MRVIVSKVVTLTATSVKLLVTQRKGNKVMIEQKELRSDLANQVVKYAVEVSEPLHDYDWQEMVEIVIDELRGCWDRNEVKR